MTNEPLAEDEIEGGCKVVVASCEGEGARIFCKSRGGARFICVWDWNLWHKLVNEMFIW